MLSRHLFTISRKANIYLGSEVIEHDHISPCSCSLERLVCTPTLDLYFSGEPAHFSSFCYCLKSNIWSCKENLGRFCNFVLRAKADC